MDLDITGAHLFYIPAILLIGGIIGFVIGKKNAEKAAAEHAVKMKEQGGGASARARRRAERREGQTGG